MSRSSTRTPGVAPSSSGVPTPGDQNLIGWNYDPAGATSGSIFTAMLGIAQLYRVKAEQSATVNNLYSCVTALGATVTNAFMGLYAPDGTRLGVSADQSANWAAGGGLETSALTAGVPVTAGSFYWIAILVGGAGTAPTFARSFSGSSAAAAYNAGLSAASFRAAANGSGLTALPESITMASNAGPTSGVVAWVAMGA